MDPPGLDPFTRAHTAIVNALALGSLAPGDPVQAVAFAKALRLSPTPVREALAYIAGSGLLVRHHRHGYAVPPLAASDLIDLFHHEALLLSMESFQNHPLAMAELDRLRLRLAPIGTGLENVLELGEPSWPLPPLSQSAVQRRLERLVAHAEGLARRVRDAVRRPLDT